MVVPRSVTSSADLRDQPCVNSVEVRVGAGPGVWDSPGVGVGPRGVLVGVGVLVFRAFGLLALADPPMMLSIKASINTAVRIMN
jgi:hypothetical protein